MPGANINLWWGEPSLAEGYRPERLRRSDVSRAEARRAPRAEMEWRVSRALIQHALPQSHESDTDASCGLSHREGHAMLAVAPPDWYVAVDLELSRPRDFDGLAAWCCSEVERMALRTLHGEDRQRFFYRLWTLKEAFVKAAALDFPADMKSVGLKPLGDGWALQAPADGFEWQGGTFALAPGWIASVVWRGRGAAHAGLTWHAAPGCVLPHMDPLWRSS